jgi:hypothetical protein
MIAADRDHQRAALGDPPRAVGDPLVVALRVRALDRDVADAIVTPTRRSRSTSTSYQP